MTPANRSRLAKLLGMTGSAHDAEALTAVRMAAQLLAQAGLTWEQIIGGIMVKDEGAVARAFEDGRRKGRQEGHGKGYAEGYAKGLLTGKNAPAARPRAWRAIAEEMLARDSRLTGWEQKFLTGFLYSRWHTPTPRQRAVLEQIADKLGIQIPPPEPHPEPAAKPPA